MKNKLSPLQELRADKAKLNLEKNELEEKLKGNFSYLTHNFGSLLFSSVAPSPKNIGQSLLGFMSPKKKNTTSGLERIYAYVPIIWEIAQPILIGILTKKLTSRIFKRKKKKK